MIIMPQSEREMGHERECSVVIYSRRSCSSVSRESRDVTLLREQKCAHFSDRREAEFLGSRLTSTTTYTDSSCFGFS